MTRAILYRHWLEMRGGLAAAGVVVALVSMFNLVAFSLVPIAWANAERVASSIDHNWSSGAAALFLGLFLGGTGLRTNSFPPGHPSLYYTLTLPASRFALICTRLVVACAATAALFAAMLVVNGLALLVTGHGVPLGAMAASSFLAGLIAVTIQAVLGLLLPLWDERLAQWAIAVGFVAIAFSVTNVANDNTATWSYDWIPAAITFIASPPATWSGAVGALALIIVASVSVASLIARRKDF